MRRLLLLTALLALLVGAAVAGYKSGATEAQSIWSTGFGFSGETLRLKSDGTYLLEPWGDLPPYKRHLGHWYRQGGKLRLVPTSATERTRILRYKRVLGCEVLLTQKISVPPPSLFPSGVTDLDFFPTRTDCYEWIQAYNRAHSVAP